MVTITLYTRQQKRHWCIEQSFGLSGRGRGWDDLGEWHSNMYNIMYEMSHQSRFDAQYWMLGAGAMGQPRGMVQGERREEGSGWGTQVYQWRIHFDIWQNQYNIVKLKNQIKLKKIKCFFNSFPFWKWQYYFYMSEWKNISFLIKIKRVHIIFLSSVFKLLLIFFFQKRKKKKLPNYSPKVQIVQKI